MPRLTLTADARNGQPPARALWSYRLAHGGIAEPFLLHRGLSASHVREPWTLPLPDLRESIAVLLVRDTDEVAETFSFGKRLSVPYRSVLVLQQGTAVFFLHCPVTAFSGSLGNGQAARGIHGNRKELISMRGRSSAG